MRSQAITDIKEVLEEVADAIFSVGMHEELEALAIKVAKKEIVKNWNEVFSQEDERLTVEEQRFLIEEINNE